MQTVKSWSYITFLGISYGPALFAFFHFYRTLCTSGLSNVPEILQFHDCNVKLYMYTENKILCYFFVPPKEALAKEAAKEGNNRSPEFKHAFILVRKCGW